MRKQFFPLFLFVGLLVAGVALQHEAGKRRKALEESLGGARVGVSLETAAAFARQLGTIGEGAPSDLLQQPVPSLERPSVALGGEERTWEPRTRDPRTGESGGGRDLSGPDATSGERESELATEFSSEFGVER